MKLLKISFLNDISRANYVLGYSIKREQEKKGMLEHLID